MVTSAWAGERNTTTSSSSNQVTAGVVLFECESSQACEAIGKAVVDRGGKVRQTFNSKLLKAISVQLSEEGDRRALEEQFKGKGITGTWEVQKMMSRTAEDEAVGKQPQKRLGRRAVNVNGSIASSRWTHVMTQVDKLHREGFTGKGIKIAVVDSGVDYKHPALGGCFGSACRVVKGDSFSSDGTRGDPIDCKGHGTEVAGVLAGYDEKEGFVGAAPNATIMAYRVIDCKGNGEEDVMMKGWEKAYEDGAQIIVSSSGLQGESWAQTPLAMLVSRIAAKGVPCVCGQGNQKERGFFTVLNPATGRGVTSVNSFARSSSTGETDGLGKLSAYGPTWDLDIKPTVGAPGREVPVTLKGGGYGFESGTSYATPLVGGIMALIAEARGGMFDPVVLNSLIMSTAEPQREPGAGLITVALQGGGLVRAWEAAHTTTLVEPAGLIFNDTEHRVESINLRIENTAETEVTYQLSNSVADTHYTSPRYGVPVDDAKAGIHLSLTSITIGAKQSATVIVSAADPKGLDSKRLPLWSGWVAVLGSDDSFLTVPYLGLAGSLRKSQVLEPEVSLSTNRLEISTPFPPGPSSNGPGGGKAGGEKVSAMILMKLGTPQLRVDMVPVDVCSSSSSSSPPSSSSSSPPPPPQEGAGTTPCVPKNMVTEQGGIQTIGQPPGYPRDYPLPEWLYVFWNGSLASGQYAPPGRYKFVIRALAIFGDASNQQDWQTIESEVLTLAYREEGPKVSPHLGSNEEGTGGIQSPQSLADELFGAPGFHDPLDIPIPGVKQNKPWSNEGTRHIQSPQSLADELFRSGLGDPREIPIPGVSGRNRGYLG
ncbi:hypothetical protein CP532_1806, partial [Ophiocordyceps camponoti-leonardi (nom. inval.)]